MLMYNGSDACKACGISLIRVAVESLVAVAPDFRGSMVPDKKEDDGERMIDRNLVEQILLNFTEDRMHPSH